MLSILFDLDDTLIQNNADLFTHTYIDLLAGYLKPAVDPKVMVPYLLEGTKKMVKKTTIAGTLENSFDTVFYPGIGLSKQQIAPLLADFYGRVFAELQPQTSPRPAAAALVRECLSRGWNTAVATNPLFPLAAVHHRLHWAGLNHNEIDFCTITAYESYHFAKPQPAFFSEVASRISAFDHPVVVVGNDLRDDIQPAVKAGMPAYWLTDPGTILPAELPQECACGSVEGILPWLEKIEKSAAFSAAGTSSALLSSLRGGAAAIDAIVREAPAEKWNVRQSDSEWCITEILCHLRDLDREINLERITTILREDQPFIAGIESDRWAVERDYLHQDGKSALVDFIAARQAIVDRLEQASPEDWERVIRHSIFGPTTLKELVRFMVSHDGNHIKQIKNQLL